MASVPSVALVPVKGAVRTAVVGIAVAGTGAAGTGAAGTGAAAVYNIAVLHMAARTAGVAYSKVVPSPLCSNQGQF